MTGSTLESGFGVRLTNTALGFGYCSQMTDRALEMRCVTNTALGFDYLGYMTGSILRHHDCDLAVSLWL